jgi:CheY-like chemotaxis protein
MIIIKTSPVPAQLWLAAGPRRDAMPSEEGKETIDVDGRSLRVLIVEDEFFISLDLQNLLRTLGHVVVGIAVSGDEAVRIAGREQPDVALMDIRLIGNRDGIDAAAEILQRFGVPSIFVTANTDLGTRARAQATQPAGFLEKPVTRDRLRLGLRSVP